MQQGFTKPAQPVTRDVVIGETITVGELANKMAVSDRSDQNNDENGRNGNHQPSYRPETAQLVAEEMGHKVVLRRENRWKKRY